MTPRQRKPSNRAVIYTRVSTEGQADSGLSLETQLTKCRALAVVHDYDVIDVITDAGFSAATLDRPGYKQLDALVRARKINAVLITKLDRLTRSVKDLADVLDLFSKKHIALVSASESLNTETAGGRMVLNVMTSVAQWEREVIGERTRDALSAKRRRRERTSRHAPTGFRLTDAGTLEPNDAERQQLALMAECRAAGYGWQSIAAELNRLGHTNQRTGQPWKWPNLRRCYLSATRHGIIETPA